MKIQTFSIKALVNLAKEVTLEHSTKKMTDNGDGTQFDEGKIALKAQEVAEFNRNEQEIVKSFGEGEYTIDFKLIV